MTDEEIKVETTAAVPEQPTAEPEEFDKERAMATIKKLREREKEADKLAKKLEAYEKAETERKQAEMSEIDKLKAQYAEAQAKAARLERESLQRQAAEAAGIPLVFAGRLQGENLEEMTEDAKAILEALPKSDGKQAPKLPTTNPGAGGTPRQTEEEILKGMGFRTYRTR